MQFHREPITSHNLVKIKFERIDEATYFARQLGTYAHQILNSERLDDFSRQRSLAALHLQAQIFNAITESAAGKGPFDNIEIEIDIDNPSKGDVANRAAFITPEELTALITPETTAWHSQQHVAPVPASAPIPAPAPDADSELELDTEDEPAHSAEIHSI